MTAKMVVCWKGGKKGRWLKMFMNEVLKRFIIGKGGKEGKLGLFEWFKREGKGRKCWKEGEWNGRKYWREGKGEGRKYWREGRGKEGDIGGKGGGRKEL